MLLLYSKWSHRTDLRLSIHRIHMRAFAGYLYHGKVDEGPLEGAEATCLAQNLQVSRCEMGWAEKTQ